MTDTQNLSKEGAAMWKNLTIAEKQPYYNEFEILKKQYEEKLAEYWKTTSTKTVRNINARRKHEGKSKIHRRQPENADKRPKGPYMRFLEHFRQSDDGKAILEAGSTAVGNGTVNVACKAGELWRAMSASDKAPYTEAFEKAYAEWKANHPSKSESL
jgi:hypothetical protein